MDQKAQRAYLVHNQSRRRLSASIHKFFQFLTLDYLSGGVARVGRNDNLEALRADIFLHLLDIETV